MGQYARWYRSKLWKARRTQQLNTHPLCTMCANDGRVVAASVVDHVVPHRGDYNLFLYGKLQSLCPSCHSGMKQAYERGSTAVAIGPDGWPINGDFSKKKIKRFDFSGGGWQKDVSLV